MDHHQDCTRLSGGACDCGLHDRPQPVRESYSHLLDRIEALEEANANRRVADLTARVKATEARLDAEPPDWMKQTHIGSDVPASDWLADAIAELLIAEYLGPEWIARIAAAVRAAIAKKFDELPLLLTMPLNSDGIAAARERAGLRRVLLGESEARDAD